ncbi:MAG TPA: acetate/propionate family kinase [Lacipirellulaceae bacterium]|nr:acetate/propionate family kinase [Lacipirellulaceae bacterium]
MTCDALVVLNVGSSSVKAQVFEAADSLESRAQGSIAGLGARPRLAWGENATERLEDDVNQADAVRKLMQLACERHQGWVVRAVGHRIVHGGETYRAPVVLTAKVRADLEALNALAPLHQAGSLAAAQVVAAMHPGVLQIGCFDSAFHASCDRLFQVYALPKHLRDQGIRRYGFHGLSYEWIARVLQVDRPELAEGRVVVAHLGNGASLCAMRGGRSVDTTMGMTTLDGLPMGTRCGSIDPGIVLYMLRQLGLSADEIERILCNESGLAGLSGISHDVRDLLASASPEAAFAIRFYALMAAQGVARMATSLGGLDAVVFTGGVGEHAAAVRQMILEYLDWMKPFEVLVVAANEEQMIAEHCWAMMKAQVKT